MILNVKTDLGTKLIEWLKSEFLLQDEIISDCRETGSFPEKMAHVVIMTGEQGRNYCETSWGELWVSFESSLMYDALNGSYGWSWSEKFNEWIDAQGYMTEYCNTWSLNIFRMDG